MGCVARKAFAMKTMVTGFWLLWVLSGAYGIAAAQR